jgi:hypothetical protein
MPIQKKTQSKAKRPFRPEIHELLKAQMGLTSAFDRLETKVAELESTVRSQAAQISYMHTELQVFGALPNTTGVQYSPRMKLVSPPKSIDRLTEMDFFKIGPQVPLGKTRVFPPLKTPPSHSSK